MAESAKTDNANLAGKLALRRHFLRTYHAAEPARVFDCCQGSGVIWKTLRAEFEIASYWGVDVKEKKGRLKIRSERVIGQRGMVENVIDVDTYGSPWRHWAAILPVVDRPITVFLTLGLVRMGGGGFIGNEALRALGLSFKRLELPASFQGRLGDLAASFLLALPYRHGLRIVEAREAPRAANARYIGVRMEPEKA